MTEPASLPILTSKQRVAVLPELLEPIEYRKSGLSLNHIIGCPLDCAYCVRHLFNNFEMKVPSALMSDEAAVQMLLDHKYFRPHVTPLQIFNRATDPFLPRVKPHTLRVLEELDKRKLKNHVLVITRWHVSAEDCAVLNSFKNIKLTILVTYSGIDDPAVEPVSSSIAADSLRTLFANENRYRTILYWRPIVPGLNDSEEHLLQARQLADYADATVFTGLFFRDEIAAYYKANGIAVPYAKSARRKIFPEKLEKRVLEAFANSTISLFRKTSCAVAYVHKLADYNGHYGIREICDICPAVQIKRCAESWAPPDPAMLLELTTQLGAKAEPQITDSAIIVDGLDESKRYFIQHNIGYQVHDIEKPHLLKQHGRADIGWEIV